MRLVVLAVASSAMAAAREMVCPADNQIKTTVPGYKRQFGTMKDVHEHLLACPSITSLDLRVTLMGCSGEPDRWNFPFRLAGGDEYPNLTSLKLEGYDFGQSDWSNALPWGSSFDAITSWIQYKCSQQWFPLWRSTPKERRHLTNLQLWLEAMDWTRLESLTLVNRVTKQFAELATPNLGGLKSLELHTGPLDTRAAALQIIVDLPTQANLTSLAWVEGWVPEGLESVLRRHGKTLQKLELYSRSWYPYEALTVPQLEMIASRTPNLTHLTLSMDRNGTWPWDTLKALARIESLVSADIWLELAADRMRGKPARARTSADISLYKDEARFRQPVLNSTTATEVFNYMLKKNNGRKFQSLTFHIGDWDRSWDGPLNMPSWLEGRKGKVECNILDANGRIKKAEDGLCVHTIDQVNSGLWDELFMETPEYLRAGEELDMLQVQLEL